MKIESTWALFAAAFVTLLLLAWSAKKEEADLRSQLAHEEAVARGREEIEASLKNDVDRLKTASDEMDAAMTAEEKEFAILHETLQNIEGKLSGVEQLNAALVILQTEYDDLNRELIRHPELLR